MDASQLNSPLLAWQCDLICILAFGKWPAANSFQCRPSLLSVQSQVHPGQHNGIPRGPSRSAAGAEVIAVINIVKKTIEAKVFFIFLSIRRIWDGQPQFFRASQPCCEFSCSRIWGSTTVFRRNRRGAPQAQKLQQ